MPETAAKSKVEIADAVNAGKKYLEKIFPSVPRGSILLEEVELTEDEKYWLITLSFEAPKLATANSTKSLVELTRAWNGHVDRTYKLFKVSASDGRVVAMKIRQV